MDIFKMAEMQLYRERKHQARDRIKLLFQRAEAIQKYLSICERNDKIAKNRIRKTKVKI